MRLRRDQRLRPVRARRAGDHLRPARHRVLRAASSRGPKQDLHSGTFGGGVTNPANALVAMLAALKDDDGRIQVPGFYDDVVPLTDARARSSSATLPFDEAEFMQPARRRRHCRAKRAITTLERRWARPTCDINGLTSGYQGEGREDGAAGPGQREVQLPPRAESGPARRSPTSLQQVPRRPRCRRASGWSWSIITARRAWSCRSTVRILRAAAAAIEAGFGRAPVLHPRRRLDPDRHHLRPRARTPTCSCWAGARTTTTRTARTKNSRSPTTTAASRPARTFGHELAKLTRLNANSTDTRSPDTPTLRSRSSSHARSADSFSKMPNVVQQNCDRRGVKVDVARFVELEIAAPEAAGRGRRALAAGERRSASRSARPRTTPSARRARTKAGGSARRRTQMQADIERLGGRGQRDPQQRCRT